MLWSYVLCSHGPHQPSACNTCTDVTLTDKAAGKADLLATTAISMVIYCQWTQHTKWNMTHNVKRTTESPAEERRFTNMKLILVVRHVSTAAEEKASCLTNMQLLYTFSMCLNLFHFCRCRWIDIQRCCLMLAYTCESKIPFFIFACNRRGGCVNVPQGNDSEFKLVYRRCLIANVRQAAIELSWFQKETFSSNAQKLWNEMTASVTSGMVVSLQWGYFCFLSLTFKGKLTQ